VRSNGRRCHAGPSPPTPSASSCTRLPTTWEKLIEIGAKVVSHGRYVTFQMAEVAVSHLMFRAS